MKANALGLRFLLSMLIVGISLLFRAPDPASSEIAAERPLLPISVAGSQNRVSPASVESPGHIDWQAILRLPCCNWPGMIAADNIAFRSDASGGLGIAISGAEVHNRWTWRYYRPDGSLESDRCFIDVRQPGEEGNPTSYVAFVTNCPEDPRYQWQVLEIFPAGCPCNSAYVWTLGLRIAGSSAWSWPGTWAIHIDYLDDYTDSGGTVVPDVAQDLMYLMYTPAVLLIHGWESDCGTVGLLQQNLEEELAIPANNLRCYDYDSRKGVQEGAEELKKNVADFRQRLALTPQEEVDLVGHSQGGLETRYYEQFESPWEEGPIGSISMLGAPNNGVVIGGIKDYLCGSNPLWRGICAGGSWAIQRHWHIDIASVAVHDMTPGSAILSALNEGFILPELPLYSAWAGGNSSKWGRVFSGSDLNDCIVSVESVAGPHGVFHPFVYYDLTHGGGSVFPECDEPSLTSDLGVVRDLAAIIKGYPAGVGPDVMDDPLTEGAADHFGDGFPLVNSLTDLATFGESSTHTLAVPAGATDMAFMVYWLDSETDEANLGLTLRRPDGQIVSPGDPDVSDQVELTGEGMFYVLFRGLIMTAPQAGDWQITVTGDLAPPEGQPYLVALMPLDSQVVLGVDVLEPQVPQGQPQVIEAALVDAGSVTAASGMVAHVSTPTENDTLLALHDDGIGGDEVAGDNVYSATFTSTQDCGAYGVRVDGGGNTSEGIVTRQQLTSFDVRVPGDAIRDPCNPDDDEDGLTDADELNTIGTDPLELDTDADGMPDGYEHGYACLNPLVNDAANDPDNDGQNNLIEYEAGTNPCAAGGAVGGLAEPPDVELGDVSEVGESPTSDSAVVIWVGLVFALGAGGWYASRRWLR